MQIQSWALLISLLSVGLSFYGMTQIQNKQAYFDSNRKVIVDLNQIFNRKRTGKKNDRKR